MLKQTWKSWGPWKSWGKKLRLLACILLVAAISYGCADYEIGVNFRDQNHGTIVQNIHLGERAIAFSSDLVEEWIASVERRARSLGGRAKRPTPTDIEVRIPFANGQELAEKIDRFFDPVERNADADESLPQIAAHMTVTQNNWLLALRTRAVYEVDLRSLAVLSSEGDVLVSPGVLLDLAFRLQAPWGLRSVESGPHAIAPIAATEKELLWKLTPGEIDRIEAVFWVPSPIGIGSLGIALLVAIAIGLKRLIRPNLGAPNLEKVAESSAG